MFLRREEYEERQYPTPGRYLRGHKAAFERAGYPVNVISPEPGVYILVVSLPMSLPQEIDPFQLPSRRRSWRLNGRQLLAWLCVACIVGGLSYLGYTIATGGTLPSWGEVAAQLPAMPWDAPALQGEPIVETTGWHWPWESTVVNAPRREQGFHWPWDAAAQQVGETVEAIKTGVTLAVLLVLLMVGLWIAAKVKGLVK